MSAFYVKNVPPVERMLRIVIAVAVIVMAVVAASGVWRKTFWAVAIGALIFWASSRSFVPSPGFTPADDKFTHFAVYGLLATLVCRIGRDWRSAVWSLMAVSASMVAWIRRRACR